MVIQALAKSLIKPLGSPWLYTENPDNPDISSKIKQKSVFCIPISIFWRTGKAPAMPTEVLG
jgi:hypothetical protein